MTVSEAQKKASKKYFDTNYKQVKLSMPNTEAEALENLSLIHISEPTRPL